MARQTRNTRNQQPPARTRGRAHPPENETKHERFVRIGTKRMDNLLRDIRLLGNLAASNYEAYPEDIGRMHSAIEHELGMAFSRFDKARREERKAFKFAANGENEPPPGKSDTA